MRKDGSGGMATAGPSEPPGASARWTILVLMSLAMFGNYYVYDALGPLADMLQKSLGFTDTQIGTLNAIYSFPNILMVLIGGIIVDRIGTRRSTLRRRSCRRASHQFHRINTMTQQASKLMRLMPLMRPVTSMAAEMNSQKSPSRVNGSVSRMANRDFPGLLMWAR